MFFRTVELSVYIRTPSIPNDMAVEKESESANAESLRAVLDQKNYLEERNRYLEYVVNFVVEIVPTCSLIDFSGQLKGAYNLESEIFSNAFPEILNFPDHAVLKFSH